jgi:hypothetical protein
MGEVRGSITGSEARAQWRPPMVADSSTAPLNQHPHPLLQPLTARRVRRLKSASAVVSGTIRSDRSHRCASPHRRQNRRAPPWMPGMTPLHGTTR